MPQLDPNRDTNHRYFIRLGLRGLIIFSLTAFIARDFIGYGAAITLCTLLLYFMSLLLRKRNQPASDLLLTLGDVPALASVVHLPSHVFAFEALSPPGSSVRQWPICVKGNLHCYPCTVR